MMLTRPRIAGIIPREPIGAVLRIGRKHPDRGHPIENDQFYIVEPNKSEFLVTRKGGGKVDVGMRRLHPAFEFYNRLPADKRRTFYGILRHHSEWDCAEWRYQAPELPGSMPAKDGGGPWPRVDGFKRAACFSEDGKTALRLYAIGEGDTLDESLDYRQIPCPNRGCEFQRRWNLPKGKKDPPCSSFARLYFMPRWKASDFDLDEVPSFQRPPMKWVTASVGSVANLIGFFNELDRFICEGLRREPGEIGLWGIPFVLRLETGTNPREKTRFPIVRVVPDGEFSDIFLAREQDLRMAGAAEVRAIAAGARDPIEAEARSQDVIDVTGVTMPAQMEIPK